MELLAPAGSPESLKAALYNGADAVYLGGARFNARQFAGNFDEHALQEAIETVRDYGKKAYITLNTLLKENELPEAVEFARKVHEHGAHAVIVQDLGLAHSLSRFFPEITVHASTQMTVTNSHGVLACESLGIKRVVLARELSVDAIQRISSNTKAELEVFIHGALCVCYSGQCLLSSFIGGRSGNRGTCAQPCRLQWRISHESDSQAYLLSPKDLMGLHELPRLEKAGVASLKIEGRMKSPEYVGTVTRIYRKYLDLLKEKGAAAFSIDQTDIEALMQIFNRGGFTSHYLKGLKAWHSFISREHPKHQGTRIGKVIASRPDAIQVALEKPLDMGDGIEVWDAGKGMPDIIVSSIVLQGKHQRHALASETPWVGDMKCLVKEGSAVYKTFSKAQAEEAKATYERGDLKTVAIGASFYMRVDEPVRLSVFDTEGNTVTCYSDETAQKANQRPLSADRIREQLQKTGETPYYVDSIVIDSDDISTIPISVLNALRRDALLELKKQRIKPVKLLEERIAESLEWRQLQASANKKPGLTAYFHKIPGTLSSLNAFISRVYLPLADRETLIALRQSFKGEIYIATSNILHDGDFDALIERFQPIQDLIDGISCGNPGSLRLMADRFPKVKLHAGFQMNLFNSWSLDCLKKWNAASATLSPELKLSEVKDIKPVIPDLEALVYGRLPVMTMAYCPGGGIKACNQQCGACDRCEGTLIDRMGAVFPYSRDKALKHTTLYNSVPLFMDELNGLKDTAINLFRLEFTDEDERLAEAIIKWFYDKIPGGSKYTTEEDRQIIERHKDKGFTRGHWQRGV